MNRPRLPGALLVLALLACEEEPPPAPLTAEEAVAAVEPGPVSMRRLTRVQYERVVADLFGRGVVVPPLSEPDVPVGGLLSVGASETSFSARGVESMEGAAFAIAEQALETAARRARLVPCEPSGDVDAACAERTVRHLGRRVWRRPLTGAEVARITGVATRAAEALGDFHGGLQYGVAALLQSPHFVFRAELGFTDYELAARLSFFLWNSTPDDALLDAAEAGLLSTDAGLLASTRRLLASDRAREGLRDYFTEQLTLYALDALAKDPTLFEHFNERLGPDAREETLRLLEHIVFDADADYRDVMTTRETFVNPRLAALYDIPSPVRSDFGPVRLPAEGGRAGLLTHASMLNLYAHQVSSSATRRGEFVRKVLLCQEIPPPPVDVDTSIPEPSGAKVTLRDRVREHLENPACAGCHSLTDPIGLGLENFDAVGRWRAREHGAVIDPSGDVDGEAFVDAVGLGRAIRDHPRFAPCVVRTMVRYATGRVEAAGEQPVLDALAERFASSGYRIRPLLVEVVMSPMFRRAGDPR